MTSKSGLISKYHAFTSHFKTFFTLMADMTVYRDNSHKLGFFLQNEMTAKSVPIYCIYYTIQQNNLTRSERFV